MKFPSVQPNMERILLFVVGGASAAFLNLVLAYVGVDLLGYSSSLEQNYVNLAAMEISLVYSFFVYRAFVWKDRNKDKIRIFLRQLPIYHLSAGSGILIRVLLFPALQWLGVYYLLNIVLGILAGAVVNYLLTNRYVFKEAAKELIP